MKKILLLVIFSSLNIQAETFNVSTTSELRVALNTAATNGEDDTIILADGTYKTTDDGEGTFVYLSNESMSLNIVGVNKERTVVSGDDTDQVFNLQSTVDNSVFNINSLTISDGAADNGAGLYFSANTIAIRNVLFLANHASTKGGGLSYNPSSRVSIMIDESEFRSNSSTSSGGAIFTSWDSGDVLHVNSTIFTENTSNRGGAIALYAYHTRSTIKNSLFIRNSGVEGGSALDIARVVKFDIVNSLFIENPKTIMFGHGSGQNGIKIVNSFFSAEDTVVGSIYDVEVALQLYNNYINEAKVFVTAFMSNNVFDGLDVQFENISDDDYRLKNTSGLIDKGTIEIEGISYPIADIDGYSRVSGGSIDIGPYEFSTIRPTINSVTFTGTAKEQSELTFTTYYTLADGRDITDVSYDFLNDGSYTPINTYTYNAVGTYTISVKVIDSEGEFSTTSTSVTIAELPFNEMTYEQKLIKAISPEYYDDLLADIALDNANATEAAKQYVQDNLTEFDLVTLADKNTAVSAATSAGITTGKQYVLENPTEFKLMGLTALKSDQNGDGKADILWRNETTGNNWLWSMDGLIIGQSKGIGSVNLDWDIAGRGDFNGDGKSDILWRNRETGLNYIWIMDGITATIRKPLNTVNGAEWQIKSVADFNGDGKADIFWHNQTTGLTYVYLMDGMSITSRGALNIVNSAFQVISK